MADGDVQDDRSILDEDVLWRRVRPTEVAFDPELGRKRPKTQAFQNHPGTDAMSLTLAREIGNSIEAALEGHADSLIVALPAKVFRANGQKLVPVPGEVAGHVHVIGRKPKSVQNQFVKRAQWIVAPPDVNSPD